MLKFLTNLTSKPQKGQMIKLIHGSNNKYDCDVIFLFEYYTQGVKGEQGFHGKDGINGTKVGR